MHTVYQNAGILGVWKSVPSSGGRYLPGERERERERERAGLRGRLVLVVQSVDG